MLKIHPNKERGLSQTSWLESYHSFSFGDYYDPSNRGYGSLRVINDDIIAPATGFDSHPHRDMEIITYVINGSLEHRDSMGNHFIIKAGDVQRMSAGTGIVHSEHNSSTNDAVRLLQIWFHPHTKNLNPSYEQKSFDKLSKTNQLKLIVSSNGDNDSLKINQDLKIYSSILNQNNELNYQTTTNRLVWLQLINGSIKLENHLLSSGDGALVKEQTAINIIGQSTEAEFLLFDFSA